MSGILDAITQKPLVAAVVVLSLVAAAILKFTRRKPTKAARPQNRPRSKRRR